MRGRIQNKKLEIRGKVTSKSRLGKDDCAFCHEEGHWKKDCPKLKKKNKGKCNTPKYTLAVFRLV